jgi:hypothetical protein
MILGHPIAVIGFLIGPWHIEPRNLEIPVRHPPMWTHPTEIPHPVLPNQIIVEDRPVEMDTPTHPGPTIFPELVLVSVQYEWDLFGLLHLPLDAVFCLDKGLVQQQETFVEIGRVKFFVETAHRTSILPAIHSLSSLVPVHCDTATVIRVAGLAKPS